MAVTKPTCDESAEDLLERLLLEETAVQPRDGVALCLSGGGYRAMLFHLGSIIRLNQIGVLSQLSRVSSVSGGSILAALLGLRWKDLKFDSRGYASNLDCLIVEPIRQLASITIDRPAIFWGFLLPGETGEVLAKKYRRIFGDATLQDLPCDSDSPTFVFNSTSVQYGSRVCISSNYILQIPYDLGVIFSKETQMARIGQAFASLEAGMIYRPNLSLAMAVAASSAFPPFLSPIEIPIDPNQWVTRRVDDKLGQAAAVKMASKLYLTDGGVYDNLGVESALRHHKTLLVSDGGGQKENQVHPKRNWVGHTIRVLDLIDQLGRKRIKENLLRSYSGGAGGNVRNGTYWSIWSNIENFYKVENDLRVGAFSEENAAIQRDVESKFRSAARVEYTRQLAATSTRLKKIDQTKQERLINWGYVICETAMRRHSPELIEANTCPAEFPYAVGIGQEI
jgi:NTE family protein